MLSLMLWPLVICLVLSLVHAYLGLHVVSRGVIFVDLAIAQLAALGTLVAFAAGVPFHTPVSYVCSLGFTMLGSLFFAMTSSMRAKNEAIIGVVYAVSAALSVILLNSIPSEAEHLKDMLVGNILFVSAQDVFRVACLYGVVGLVHYLFRRQFWAISLSKNVGGRRWKWDFLFYALFGVVVTSSVSVAGVLLVFSYLIIPSVVAVVMADRILYRVFAAWGVGVVGSVFGVLCSIHWDLPTGPAIILLLAVVGSIFLIIKGTIFRILGLPFKI